MAKYVGKIFKIPDKHLRLRGNGAHMVKITWYNPLKRIFYGRVITSLEERKVLTKEDKKFLHLQTYHREQDDVFLLLKRNKYEKIRNGNITPIPVTKAKGLSVWSGFSERKKIHISKLKNLHPEKVVIEK